MTSTDSAVLTGGALGNRIDGNAIAAELRSELTEGVKQLLEQNNIVPGLTVVLVGSRGDSATYVRMKEKAAVAAGMKFQLCKKDENVTEQELIDTIAALNKDASIHGIIVQLPLPDHINETRVLDVVAFEKDIDGFHPQNIGSVAMKGRTPSFAPCTPEGIMTLLKKTGVELSGKKAVVLGRSNIVGIPIALMLIKANATVTVCHSRTQNIEEEVKKADIVVSAIGQAKFVKGDWIKEGAVVIDVGTNSIPDATKKSGQRLVGDVDYATAKLKASWITPVPGGVGPMTVATLLQHVLIGAQRACGQTTNEE